MLEKFLQTLMDGLAVGSLYALIALGYTMVYGILKFINFAHSDVFVLGAWLSFSAAMAAGWSDIDPNTPGIQPHHIAAWLPYLLGAITALGLGAFLFERFVRPTLPQPVLARLPAPGYGPVILLAGVWGFIGLGLVSIIRAMKTDEALPPGSSIPWADIAAGGVILVLAMVACGLIGFTIERLAYKPLRDAPRLNVLITAIGVSLLLQNLGQLDWMFGTSPQRMPTLMPDLVLAEIGGSQGEAGAPGARPVLVRLIDVVVAATAVLLMVALDWLVFRTKLGRAMRAVSFNPPVASLMGINVDRIISTTFVIGAALAAAAGFLYSQKYPGLGQPASAAWVLLGLKAFVAAVVGGIGNIRGAMMGGVLIGLLEFFGMAYISPELRDVYVFGLLILVLLFRPTGLLGKTTVEKV